MLSIFSQKHADFGNLVFVMQVYVMPLKGQTRKILGWLKFCPQNRSPNVVIRVIFLRSSTIVKFYYFVLLLLSISLIILLHCRPLPLRQSPTPSPSETRQSRQPCGRGRQPSGWGRYFSRRKSKGLATFQISGACTQVLYNIKLKNFIWHLQY